MRDTYLITTTGDGAHERTVAGTWDDLVSAVAAEMYSAPKGADREEVRGMLENGIDGDDGWDGKSVLLRFEDGSLAVRMLPPCPHPSPVGGVCEVCGAVGV